MGKLVDIYIMKDNKVVGTVGWFYYSKLSIKELLDFYSDLGCKLRF